MQPCAEKVDPETDEDPARARWPPAWRVLTDMSSFLARAQIRRPIARAARAIARGRRGRRRGDGARPGCRRHGRPPRRRPAPSPGARRGPRARAGRRRSAPSAEQRPHRRVADGRGLVGEQELGDAAVPAAARLHRRAPLDARPPRSSRTSRAPSVRSISSAFVASRRLGRDGAGPASCVGRASASSPRRAGARGRRASSARSPGRGRKRCDWPLTTALAIWLSAGQWFSGITRRRNSSAT